MSEVKWIKLSTDIFDNRKIRQIELMPHGSELVLIWVKLLCMAGNINDSGKVYCTTDIPFTCEMLANQFNSNSDIVHEALNTFKKYGMLEDSDMIIIKNWEKYQNVASLELIRAGNRERQKKWYYKQKNKEEKIPNVSLTSDLTLSNTIDKNKIRKEEEENRLEENRIDTTTLSINNAERTIQFEEHIERNRDVLSFITDEQLYGLLKKYPWGKVYMRAKRLKGEKTYENLVNFIKEY